MTSFLVHDNPQATSPLPEGFLSRLQSTITPLLSDGAMGTLLNARGVSFEQCFDALNITQPDLVAEVHRAYLEAGTDMIQTNTFGANRYKLSA
jgi:homocysteine S-methyltransferase